MNIHIEYCEKWNYKPEFDRVSKIIKKYAPEYKINGNENYPRSGAFEITLNNKLVYSKFKTNSFPIEVELKTILNS